LSQVLWFKLKILYKFGEEAISEHRETSECVFGKNLKSRFKQINDIIFLKWNKING